MTLSHLGEEIETARRPGPTEAGPEPEPGLTPVEDAGSWEVDFREGLSGEASPEVGTGLLISCTGAGEAVVSAPHPLPVPAGTAALRLWIEAPGPGDAQAPELLVLLSGGQERSMGRLDFAGRHLLRRTLPSGTSIAGLVIRGLFHRETADITLSGLAFEAEETQPLPPAAPREPASMRPSTSEEVTNSIQKDGISFVFEARSLSAVVRYVYTPIEGNLSDFEVEINNGDAIKLAEDGGITVSMEGREWSPEDEQIERHFVSCERVGDAVEARWQFRRGSELADFLYRVRIQGKSLVVELEGGGGRASGVELGYVVGAIHPRLIQVPYLNLGDRQPNVLCTSGVFVSSCLDLCRSRASSLYAAPAEADQLMHLNGGCRYLPASDGRRAALQECWILTVSRRFEEVLPSRPAVDEAEGPAPLSKRSIWCQLPEMEAGEEAYIEAYERLRMYRQVGLRDLLVLHPESTWHDGLGGPAIDTVGADAKGGDDALLEYLEAVRELGYEYALNASFRQISPLDEAWPEAPAALDESGDYTVTGPGRYLLKPDAAAPLAPGRVERLVKRYGASAVYLTDHAAAPPWARLDRDVRLAAPASFRHTWQCEQELLAALRRQDVPVVADGGHHWLYAGLLSGAVGRLRGESPARQPLLVDFDLGWLHDRQTDAGLGAPEEYFGETIPTEERHARSAWFDRYLAAVVACGHAGLLPDLERWGLPAVAKTYYMLRALQDHYLGVKPESIHYQRGGNLLETTEALVAGAHELSQIRVVYANGLQVHVNGAREEEWVIEAEEETSYRLPPASFLARGPGGLLVYSADAGSGRIDYAACAEYLYCDTRGQRMTMGPLTLDGAAVLTHEDWVIDIYPLDCDEPLEVDPTLLWKDRRMPPLRVLAFRDDAEEPEVVSANASAEGIRLAPQEDVCRYRITLPEWMIEPGK